MSAPETFWFPLPSRGLIAVRGSERVRWLDGMVTNEIAGLDDVRNGCHAVLLTRQGRVVADLHVWAWPEEIWLELEASFCGRVVEALDRYIIADDVTLEEITGAFRRFALEGPAARKVLEDSSTDALPEADHAARRLEIGGVPCAVSAYAFGSGPGFQIAVAAEDAAVLDARILSSAEVTHGDEKLLEVTRIVAGTPRLGADLDDTVLPDEARLEDAISTSKGCYTGQEVVARLRSRGRIKHRLVGLRFEAFVAPGARLLHGGTAIGEVTSSVDAGALGVIGLGFVRAEQSDPGGRLEAEGASGAVAVEVAALPLDAP